MKRFFFERETSECDCAVRLGRNLNRVCRKSSAKNVSKRFFFKECVNVWSIFYHKVALLAKPEGLSRLQLFSHKFALLAKQFAAT